MTLKEKFKKIDIKLSKNHSTKIVDVEAIQCVKIADEFAIEFAEWYLNLSKSDDWEKFDNNTNKQLLEIFKIEKRL